MMKLTFLGISSGTVEVPNLVLTHFSARHQNEEGMRELITETETHYRGNAFLANDLDVFELDSAGHVTVTRA